jgi:light-regulated signal transduction histidine kinase (bacteriophytochrome)
MDSIRGLLDKMTTMEEADLQERQAEAQTSAHQTVWFFALTLVLSLFFMGLGFFLLEKNRKNRQTLVDYTAKLKESNQDLQDFIFIATHDLQEPLRKIHSFGSILKEEMGPRLTPDAADCLFRMQDAAQRMSGLIANLLRLTGITTQAKDFQMVDLSVVMEEVKSDLEIPLKECGGRVEIGPLPRLEADVDQMRQLFQNLLGNALKYRKADTAPLVQVESETDPKTRKVCVRVRDNGIGFEQRHAKKIFNIFQRLHANGEFEGAGIGLAICRKVVERHKGVITAQAQVGKGATFEIVLPLTQKQ